VPDTEWRELKFPFLFCGYFECDHCHRPIHVRVQLQAPDDWKNQLFDARCEACGHGTINRPGYQVEEYSLVHWNRKTRSLHDIDDNGR